MTTETDTAGYASLGTEDQVAYLRDIAIRGSAEFGLEPVGVELVLHGFNTTFRVDRSDGSRYALRVLTNSLSTPAHVLAQHDWMRALAEQTDVPVPVPMRTHDGGDVAVVRSNGPASHHVVAATWLDGDDIGDTFTGEQARALGRAMATMHDHAGTWTIPTGGHLDGFDDPYYGDIDRLSAAFAERPEDRAIFEAALDRCSAAMTVAATADPAMIIHGDLHGWNLKWHRDRLAVFDFDDCGLAAPALDLAITTFYLRDGSGDVAEEALRDGYRQIRPVPETDDFEALVAARQLLLANDLLGATTSELRRKALPYLDRSIERLTRWLESGRFTR